MGVEPCHADESLAADMAGAPACLAHALHVLPVGRVGAELLQTQTTILKVHKIEIFFGFDFEICNISLLVMSKY